MLIWSSIVNKLHDKYLSTKISDKVHVRSLRFFSLITRVSAIECSDLVGWNRIFQEFQPSYIKEEDKKYKFSTDFSTIFLSKGIC